MKSRSNRNICTIEKCNKKQHSKSGYCLTHLPENLRCQANTNKGTRCHLPIIPGEKTCKVHSPSNKVNIKSSKDGFVYLFDPKRKNAKNKHLIKIGLSSNPEFLLNTLRIGNPFGSMLFIALLGREAKTIKNRIHRKYAVLRMEKDWYWLTESNISEIKEDLTLCVLNSDKV